MHYLNEWNIFIFLVQMAVLLGCARALGEVFRRLGQPTVTAEILVGVLFGPTVFGRLCPSYHSAMFPTDATQQTMLDTVAWLGILFFLLRTGLETSFAAAWKLKGEAIKVSFADLILPLVIAFVPTYFLPSSCFGEHASRFMFAMFVATIMTISALPVTARVLQELRIYRTDTSLLIMSALTINDVAGWVVFALILSTVTENSGNIASLVWIVFGTFAFAGISLTAGRRLMEWAFAATVKGRASEHGASLTLVCLAGLVCGAITTKIGIHSLFGFFIAGIMVGEARSLPEHTRNVFSQMVQAILVPIFFASIGLKIDFLAGFNIWLVLFIFIIGVGGRFIGAWVGCMWANIPRSGWSLVSAAHVPGGEMQIVIGILALEYGVISAKVFVAVVVGAVFSSMLAGPWMKRSLMRMRQLDWLAYLTSEAIIADMTSKTMDEAIDVLSKVAAGLEDMPAAQSIAAAVLEREKTMPTSLENGISVPHARLENITEAVVVMGRSIEGIDWNSRDGKPTNLVFMIITPVNDTETQLQILRGIAQTLLVPAKRAKVLAAADGTAILRELRG